MNKNVKKTRGVSQIAFDVVYSSAEMEGYSFKGKITNSQGMYRDIPSQVILDFLELDETKVTFLMTDTEPVMIAYNSVANETIEITGLGDHFMALIHTVSMANKKIKARENGEEVKLLTNKFIKDLNKQLLYIRQDEVAIGEYRDVDFLGRPMDVHHSMKDDNGNYKRCLSANIESSANKNVINKMNELVDWVNDVAFKEGRDILLDVAEFHARFVQIQPFRDGNKRCARLLSNYLLLIFNYPFIDINEDNREEYLANIYYATAKDENIFRSESTYFKNIHEAIYSKNGPRTEENKYVPLKEFFEKNLINETSNKIIQDILVYDNRCKFHANQINNIDIKKA